MQASAGLPLAGVRVVDYSHYLAGPHLSRCLAAMGAEVIKVERPKIGEAGRAHPYFKGGDSGYFLQQNMGKSGLCLDLKHDEGKAFFDKLLQGADVLVENYRPGTLDKLGFGYEAVSKINPRLIYCSVSAYGHTGPKSKKPGFGLLAEAESGAMAQMGESDQPPPLMRMPIADMYTGVHGVAAVSAALYGRTNSGRGCHVDLALLDCMVSMHDYAVQSYTLSGGSVIPDRVGHHLPDSTIYGVFSAKDGYIVIAAQVDDAWLKLARLVGGDELAADTRFHGSANRNANRAAAILKVEAWVASQLSRAACLETLDAAGVPAAMVQRIDDVVADPQVQARGMLIRQKHPELGEITLPNLPFRFTGTAPRDWEVAPKLGQDNARIARSLGYSDAEIQELVTHGVLHSGA